jgi:hypothetical protein
MKKSLMLGAMALTAAATVSTAASAKSYQYGFYTPSGGAYCDGLNFTVSGHVASGYHVYDQNYCVYPNSVIGGFKGTVPVLGKKGEWFSLAGSQASGDGLPNVYTLVYYADAKTMTWALAYESTTYGIPFTVINEGTLQKGPPFAHVTPGRKNLGSTLKVGLAHIKK